MSNVQPIPPQGSILDDIREIRESRRLSWDNTPDGPLSKESDLDEWTLPLYDLHLDKQSAANPFKHIDGDEVGLLLDVLFAQFDLNEKEERLKRYRLAIAREKAGDF